MRVEIIKMVILAFLIVLSILTLYFTKKEKSKSAVFEGFGVDDPMPRDFDNKTLSDEQLYGDIPQAATLSIFKKAELKGLTADPDSIPIADGDNRGNGGGPQLTVTDIPQQETPPDDIEAVLNAALDAPEIPEETVEEGFSDIEEGFAAAKKPAPPPKPAAKAAAAPAASVANAASAASAISNIAPGNANAAKASAALAVAADPKAAAQAKAAELASAQAAKLGIPVSIPGSIPLRTFDTSTPQGLLAQKAQDKAVELAKAQAAKLKNAVMKRLKNSKAAKMVGKAVAKAKAVVLKGVKKVTQKIAGLFAKKLGSKVGAKATAGIFKKLITKLMTKLTTAVAKAQAGAAAMASNPFTLAIGIMISVISGVAAAIGMVLPVVLQGDEGICEPGWKKISEVWPAFLDNIPFIGDVMGVIAPYLCFLDACDANEDESAGLCYDKCDNGYHGVATMCVANSNPSDPKKPAMRPCGPGLRDDQTSCWKDTLPNGVGTPMRIWGGNTTGGGNCSGGCRTWWDGCASRAAGWAGGGCIGGSKTECSPIRCDPLVTHPIQSSCDSKVEVAGLCYNRCPSGYKFRGGNLCEPDGGPRIETTMMQRQYCPDADREMAQTLSNIDQQCYKKCPADTPYRVPVIPTLCSAAKKVAAGKRGELTSTYDRGVGRPKLKLKPVKKTPPPPPPPSPWMSAAYADDPETLCTVDFSDVKILQDMCDFYYTSAVTNSNVNADGSVSFGYITKITKVIGSSEQSADVLCDITNVVVNMDTGKTVSTQVAAGSDRRFYFAKIEKICKFIVVGATNANKTAPDLTTSQPGDAKDVNFTPVIQKCANIPIGLKKCQGQDSIEAMIAMYKKTLPPTVRIKSVDAVENSGTDVCAVAWKEVTFDPSTNVESAPIAKVGKFKFVQDKSNDACAYKLQSYSAGNPTDAVKALPKPVTYDAPAPSDVTLQGCATTCKDPEMLKKLVGAFNAQPGSNRILAVSKVVTPSQLRCDIEADVFVGQTKVTEKQKIRFDLTKDQASCVFTVKTVGAAGSGAFIQSNTKALDASLSTKDFVTSSQTEAVKSAQTNLAASASKITEKQGEANTAFESTFSQFGQVQTLGSCPKKCSDPDILNAIITFYNNANYPKTRAGVTKKTVGRVLKAGTAGKNICDILFEEKQEKYGDLYTDTPTVNVTQKTQRFTMKDTGGCQFVVDSQEGFTNGLPMREGFLVTKAPSVVNTRTPSLNPVYTGTGCELDCTKSEVMTAMKQKYQSANIEGFQNRKVRRGGGFFSGLFANFNEAFQDVAEGGDPVAVEEATVSEEAAVSEETPADQGTADWNAAATEEVAVEETAVVDADAPKPKVVKSTNMKKVNRVLKLGTDKCEYEVVYDSTDTDSNGNTTAVNDAIGYFTAVFTKDATGCSFSPSQVTKSTKPIITTVPNTKTANIAFSF
jgi:hypothetical protein